MANDGVKNPTGCKFSQSVSEQDLTEVIEVLICTEKSKNIIEGVSIWEQ